MVRRHLYLSDSLIDECKRFTPAGLVRVTMDVGRRLPVIDRFIESSQDDFSRISDEQN
jgi:hypothetical protein